MENVAIILGKKEDPEGQRTFYHNRKRAALKLSRSAPDPGRDYSTKNDC